MISKIAFTFIFLFIACHIAKGQKIVIDTSTSSKYLVTKAPNKVENNLSDDTNQSKEISFGERALSIGTGILNRLKARLNLEDAAESIKEKGNRFSKSETKTEETQKQSDQGG